jgi:hypothetical protein
MCGSDRSAVASFEALASSLRLDMANERRTIHWGAVMPALVGLVGVLVGGAITFAVSERQTARQDERQVTERRIAAYSELSTATSTMILDFDKSLEGLLAIPGEDPEWPDLPEVTAEMARVSERLLTDLRTVEAAATKIGVVGTDRASKAAQDVAGSAYGIAGRFENGGSSKSDIDHWTVAPRLNPSLKLYDISQRFQSIVRQETDS